MSDDLIKRSDAIEHLKKWFHGKGWMVSDEDCKSILWDIPSADRPQGEWITKTENCQPYWACSECGTWALLDYHEQMCLSNYCPNCGCRMKGADDA